MHMLRLHDSLSMHAAGHNQRTNPFSRFVQARFLEITNLPFTPDYRYIAEHAHPDQIKHPFYFSRPDLCSAFEHDTMLSIKEKTAFAVLYQVYLSFSSTVLNFSGRGAVISILSPVVGCVNARLYAWSMSLGI